MRFGCILLNKILSIDCNDYSSCQIDVLSKIADQYGEDVASAVADCQIESDMMLLVGNCIGKGHTTKEDIEKYINENYGLSSIYEVCDGYSDYKDFEQYLNDMLNGESQSASPSMR